MEGGTGEGGMLGPTDEKFLNDPSVERGQHLLKKERPVISLLVKVKFVIKAV